MNLVPKNWGLFQHYKDRCPPWIKLHRDLLNDRKFICLPTASKALAPLLWLLASESKDGVFDASVPELEFRLRMTTEEIEVGLTGLIRNGFFLDASTMLAPCLRPAIPETEESRGEEEKRHINKKEKRQNNIAAIKPEDVSEQVWSDFLIHRKVKKAAVSDTVVNHIRKQAGLCNWSLEMALQEMCARGWTGFRADWLDKTLPGGKRQAQPEKFASRDYGAGGKL